MNLSFRNLFFVDKEMFSKEKRATHEDHQRKVSWVYYSTMTLGLWLMAGPPTFAFEVSEMVWSNLFSGFILFVLSYFAMKPYNLWAQWGIMLLGIWLLLAPVLFYAEEGAALLSNFIVGTLAITFSVIVPRQPGIKLFAQPGPNVPPGWSYNPSSWPERIPVIFLAWIGFFIARYMGAFQLEIIGSVWDPIFGDGTRKVLNSDVSESFPVSDSLLGAFSYLLDVLFGCAGGTHRWRTMPWVVILFGILVIPLGVVSITLIILQPLSVGNWCTLCLSSALISTIMIPFTVDEVLATVQLIRAERKKGTPFWTVFWFGGTMEGGKIQEKQDPSVLLGNTIKESASDLLKRPWNLSLIIAVGVWIMLAPSALGYSGAIADSNHLTGALVITFAIISMSEVARSLRLLNVAFGLWLIAAPWVLGTGQDSALWNGVMTGIFLIILCFRKGKIDEEKGGFNKYIK